MSRISSLAFLSFTSLALALPASAFAAPSVRTEIKVMVKASEIRSAMKALKLKTSRAQKRKVYFYDTSGLWLYQKGLILRARQISRAPDDSTVKRRPMTVSQVAKKWFSEKGFKCEIDRVGSKKVSSCSLTVRQKRGEISSVARGRRAVDKLFSKAQEDFVKRYGGRSLDWKAVKALGPVAVYVWKFKDSRFPYKLTAERWRLPNGQIFFELSTKVASRIATSTFRKFNDFLKKLGVDPSGVGQTKTKATLDYFSKR